MARLGPWWVAPVAAVAGCVGERPGLPLVQPDPFRPGAVIETPEVPKVPLATTEAARRVSAVGRKLLDANRQTGLRPALHTVGKPEPEIFHRGVNEIYITEGAVGLCETDEQLAAVLAMEMGRMVAEREALAPPEARQPDRLPPVSTPVGNDSRGTFGPADGTSLVELSRFEKEHGKPGVPLPAPDPEALARRYLANAGYKAKALEDAAPVLRAARANVALERQITDTPVRPFAP